MYSWLYRTLIYPVYHHLLQDGAVEAVQELRDSDSLSADALQRLQDRKLASLLRHALSTVPYYRDLALEDSIDLSSESASRYLSSFPLLDKDIIRGNNDRLVSENLAGNRIDANSTSGSSGSPLSFYTDRRSKAYRKATVIRNREWLGIRPGDPVVHLWGSPIDRRRTESFRGVLHSWLTRETLLDAYQLSNDDLDRYIDTIRRKRARLLVGYPSVLTRFAAYCGDRKITFPHLRAIVSSAETLYPHQAEEIESHLGTTVFNRYGCREVGDIAHEVPGCDGLVVNADRIHVEILDEAGNACPPGVQGEIVVTDLDNYGMPFIRYRIGDLGVWAAPSPTATGHKFPVLESVDGRSLDVVLAPNGNRLGGTFWTILLRTKPGIHMFQVVQEKADNITIRVVPAGAGAKVDEDYFRSQIIEKCGSEMNVFFRYEQTIEAEANGKYRVVISHLR